MSDTATFRKMANEALSNLTATITEAFASLRHQIKSQNSDINRFLNHVKAQDARIAELERKLEALTRQGNGMWLQ